jgi:hypothetical protein
MVGRRERMGVCGDVVFGSSFSLLKRTGQVVV